MSRLPPLLDQKLTRFALALVDQQRARLLVPPQQNAAGFWFGGGNLALDDRGRLFLVGRYRNAGDSRLGLAAGERGLELAIFCSEDGGQTFHKRVSFSKSDLDLPGRRVLSIEGSALRIAAHGVELFVSTEKEGIGYPPGFESYLKPGTGVWTIERLAADSVGQLKGAAIETVLASPNPATLHVKDPCLYETAAGSLVLMYCTHPYCWSSSNTAFAVRRRKATAFGLADADFFPRGPAWDVAITRGTCLLDVPRVGPFQDRRVTLLFYDGGESLRNLDEHTMAVRRPRGYSCEEIGGVAYLLNGNFRHIFRLSEHAPLFLSPHGTGCSRYVKIIETAAGYLATWQQSQPDLSQPLVSSVLPRGIATQLLTA